MKLYHLSSDGCVFLVIKAFDNRWWMLRLIRLNDKYHSKILAIIAVHIKFGFSHFFILLNSPPSEGLFFSKYTFWQIIFRYKLVTSKMENSSQELGRVFYTYTDSPDESIVASRRHSSKARLSNDINEWAEVAKDPSTQERNSYP